MMSKVSTETVSPQKSIGDNLNYSFDYVYDENYAHRLVRAGERYYQYDENGNVVIEQDGSFEDNGDEPVTYHKITQEAEDVYSTDYGWGLFKDEDESGHGASAARYRRTYAWNERNQLISSVDSNYSTAYVYGQDGQRSNKYTQSSETLYFNKMWTLHTDSGNNVYGGQTAKNIYLGETRIVTKLNGGSDPTYQEEYYKQYFYHSDHLGSASLISDYKGDEYQRIEYTPYGETWVEKTQNTGLEFLPYKFTAKELDKETGLYYYESGYGVAFVGAVAIESLVAKTISMILSKTKENGQPKNYVYHMTNFAPFVEKLKEIGVEAININIGGGTSRFGNKFYVAGDKVTSLCETKNPGVLLKFTMLENANILDLANPKIADSLGYQLGLSHETSQKLMKKWNLTGIDAIKYPSEQNPGGVNYAVMNPAILRFEGVE